MVRIVADEQICFFKNRPEVFQSFLRETSIFIRFVIVNADDGQIKLGHIAESGFQEIIACFNVKNNFFHLIISAIVSFVTSISFPVESSLILSLPVFTSFSPITTTKGILFLSAYLNCSPIFLKE